MKRWLRGRARGEVESTKVPSERVEWSDEAVEKAPVKEGGSLLRWNDDDCFAGKEEAMEFPRAAFPSKLRWI